MAHLLEINIHPHHFPLPKKQDIFDSGYHSADDTTSSFTTSPTTSTSSRRSSFSSYHTTKYSRQSLPLPRGYQTLKSANERIEYLEDQIKTRKLSNGSIIKDMSFQIETFIKNRSDPSSYRNTDSSLGPMVDKLIELKDIVTKHNITLTQDTAPTDLKKQIFFSTQIIESWIHSATQHKSTKQDLQNVESKHQRLVQAIQSLSQQHTSTKQQLIQLEKLYKLKIEKELKLSKEKTEIEQDKNEIEQLLDEVRNEMENMMEELNNVKSERERYCEKSKRYEMDLKSIEMDENDDQVVALQGLLRESETQVRQMEVDYHDQISIHASENKDLKTKLVRAERSVAELSLMMEVKKRQQQSAEMEQALRRTVAERDGELAKVRFELEKSQRHTEQMKTQRDKQMQLELNTRLEDLEDELKSQYKKEGDTYQVRISRELRDISGLLVELETEVQDLEHQHEQDMKRSIDTEDKLKRLQSCFESNEKSSKQCIQELQEKVQVLEGEVLLLYGKNLELAQHLGELDE